MLRKLPYCIRALVCRRGSTTVGYSSLALLAAIAAVTLLGYTDTGAGGALHQRSPGTTTSD